MRPHLIIVAAALLILCQAVADRSEATVVRDGKGGSVNPAVDAGGQRLAPAAPIAFPYSLIGALWANDQCYPPFGVRPLPEVNLFDWRRHRVFRRTFGRNSLVRFRRPMR
jgi:hypothetical protein